MGFEVWVKACWSLKSHRILMCLMVPYDIDSSLDSAPGIPVFCWWALNQWLLSVLELGFSIEPYLDAFLGTFCRVDLEFEPFMA